MLRTLLVIHQAPSFTEAARRLGVEQSTISYRIKALRAIFGDPLFVRSGNAVEPTPRCAAIVAQLHPIVAAVEALADRAAFVPGEADGEIVISCNFHERRSLIPAAVRRLRAEAPRLRIELHEAAVDGRRQLKENLADIVLGPVEMLGDLFYRRHLFTDRYVCVMDPANPLASGPLTLERYFAAEHLMVTHNRRWEAIFLPLLRARGFAGRAAVSVPSHDSIEGMLAGSGLVASVPERLAQDYAGRLAIRPFPIDVPIEISMFWTERTHHSGLHAWVRQVLAETTRRMKRVAAP